MSQDDFKMPEDRDPLPEDWLGFLKRTSNENKALRDKDPFGYLENGSAAFNDYRKKHPDQSVILPANADLEKADLGNANLQGAYLVDANFKGAALGNANLQGAYLGNAKLRGADFKEARLQGARLEGAKLQGAKLPRAYLQGANLWDAKLQRAVLWEANLQEADLREAKLQGADLGRADIRNADISGACLESAHLGYAHVDGGTLFCRCSINSKTDFIGVGLASARLEPGLRQELEYNIRRRRWEAWYKDHPFWRWPVRVFWAFSDYGRSGLWIIAWFVMLALVFAYIYYAWGVYDYYAFGNQEAPGVVAGLFPKGGEEAKPVLILVRAVYFSVVTMTTLGFGDIYANPGSYCGHILLMIQVLLGYVLLGALITKLAI